MQGDVSWSGRVRCERNSIVAIDTPAVNREFCLKKEILFISPIKSLHTNRTSINHIPGNRTKKFCSPANKYPLNMLLQINDAEWLSVEEYSFKSIKARLITEKKRIGIPKLFNVLCQGCGR